MNKPSRLTRRSWGALVAGAPLIAHVAAQQPPSSPLAGPEAASPEQRLAKATDDIRKVSDRLAQTEVPMQVEPAFLFRA